MKAAVILFILVACTLAFVAGLNARAPTNPLLIDAAFHTAQPVMLFAPCPLSERNFPRYEERKA